MQKNTQTILDKILYSKKLYIEQTENVEKEKYIEHLLLLDLISQIKKNITSHDYCEKLFLNAQSEFRKKGGKKTYLNFLKDFLKEDFFKNKDFVITDLIMMGVDHYSCEIIFLLNNKKYSIEMPILENLNKNNFLFAHQGMFTLFDVIDEKAYCESIIQSYNPQDISNYLKTL